MAAPRKATSARRATSSGKIPLYLVVDPELLDDLDAWVEDLRKAGGPGSSGITRTDLIRDLLAKAVAERKS